MRKKRKKDTRNPEKWHFDKATNKWSRVKNRQDTVAAVETPESDLQYWQRIAGMNSQQFDAAKERIKWLERELEIVQNHRETLMHGQVLFRTQIDTLQQAAGINSVDPRTVNTAF